MTQNNHLDLIKSLEDARDKLDHKNVNWINKYFVIELHEKSNLLLESITRLGGDDQEHAVTAAEEFLTVIKPVIQELNSKKKD